jgi:beta-glucosidase
VVVVGDGPGAEGPNDHPNPTLDPSQQALVTALQQTGKPVIEVVVADRPLVLGSAATPDALLMSWLPGTQGGGAVADLLFGKANPSGKLPVSWPKAIGNEPEFYQQLPGTNSGTDSGYSPLFPFGAGLSYTSFTIGAATPDKSTTGRGGSLGVSVPVADTGSRDGDLIVPLYASQPVSRVLAPPRWLVGFTRVHLTAGQHTTVHISVNLSSLARTEGDVNGAGPQVVEPGQYTLSAGDALNATKGGSFTVQ